MRARPAHRFCAAIVLTLTTVIALAGCTATGSEPAATPSSAAPIEAQSSPTPAATRSGPILRPGESAAANRQLFDLLNTEYHDAQGQGEGRSIVDNLVDNGFAKKDIEVTTDDTAIGLAADSIVVSVRIKGECLLGQFSPDEYVSAIEPLLSTGVCLVGKTRPIDW